MNQMKKSRTNWPESVVLCMLDIFKEKHILSHLDHSKYRNSDIFKTIEKSMVERGLNYSVDQIRIKWKALKVAYKNVIKHNSRSGVDRITCPYYDELDSLLGHRPGTGILVDGIDSDILNVDRVDEDPTNTQIISDFFNEIEATQENNTEPVNCDTKETSLCVNIENSDCSAACQKVSKLLNKTKSVRSAPYARALKGFSMEFMESQRQLQIEFFEQQSKLNNEYFEKQKAWEEKVMQKEEEIVLADRASNEFMMNNIMQFMQRQINNTNSYTPTMHIPAYPSTSYMHFPSTSSSTQLPTSYTNLPSTSSSTQLPTSYTNLPSTSSSTQLPTSYTNLPSTSSSTQQLFSASFQTEQE